MAMCGGRSWCTLRSLVKVLLVLALLCVSFQLALYVCKQQQSSRPHLPRETPAVSSSSVHKHAPAQYPFLINTPDACNGKTELVIVVVSAVNNSDDRMAVRETWGTYAADPAHNVSLVFLLGASGSAERQATVARESETYKDIVQGRFVDTYRNLTLKSVALLRWVTSFCNKSKFVLKADDDSYINVRNLITALRQQKDDVFIMGSVYGRSRPFADKKSIWYVPREEYPNKTYPVYVAGAAYSMSTKAAMLLDEAAKKVKQFWIEDVYITGLCARKANITVLHHAGFNYRRLSLDGCTHRKVINGHKYTARDKRQIHKEVYDPKLRCKR